MMQFLSGVSLHRSLACVMWQVLRELGTPATEGVHATADVEC